MNKQELQEELQLLRDELEDFEIDPDDYEGQYRDMLDGCYGVLNVCGYKYGASSVLARMDPTAYRCGLNDYVDGLEKEEDPKYKEIREKMESLENEIDSL